jgi:hypothetical protein
MGLSHSPSIVSENLEFYIDPSNTRSYPGFGNTVYNLINSSMGCTFVNFTANPIDNANNRSIFFDNASNNALFIPSSSLQFGSSDFTIQFWFKFPGYTNNNGKAIFSDSWGPTNGGFLFYTYQSGGVEKILFYSTSTDGSWNIALEKDLIVSPSFNTWYNVAVTRTGSVFTLYANGQVTNTFSSSLSLRNTGLPYSLGASPTVANASKCSIGSVFIYKDKGLSAAEINQNYHATKKQYLVEENIVTNGLTFNLDSANSSLYSGVGNTIFNLSGTGATLVNGVQFTNLNSGSFVFDGTNDYIDVSNPNLLAFGTNPFTIDLWLYSTYVYPGSGYNYGTILTSYTNYNSDFGTYFYLALFKNAAGLNNIVSFLDSSGNFMGVFGANINVNEWTNITFTRSGNNLVCYKNGVSVSTQSLANNFSGTRNARIGGGVVSINTFQGSIPLIKVYNRTLTPIEIQQNYNASKNRFINVLPIVRNDLILNLDAANTASYPGSGTSWFDLSGSNNTSVLTNGPTFSATGNSSSIIFDGSNDYVVVNSNANLLSKTEYTKFVFFYATSFSTANNLISGGVSGTNHAFWLNFSNRLYAGHNASWSTVTGSTTLSANTWYCGAVTYSNVSGWKLYLNGVLDGTSVTSTTFDNNGELLIAAYANANVFTGRMPLALVYNRALSAYEIKQNFDFYRTRYGI